jgi:hypothetical protein
MAKWWMGAALVTLGASLPAQAQGPNMPLSGKPTVMPEPIPCFESPGPMSPPAACADADSPNSLRGDFPNSWCDLPPSAPAVYASLGYMALQRQKLGHNLAAFRDPGTVDTGDYPPVGSPILLDFHDIYPRFGSAVTGMIGYHCGQHSFELSGFYMSQSASSKTIALPGQIDTPFINFPVGFEGDNNLFLQADVARIMLQTAITSVEANYRWWLGADSNFSWTIGVRYVDLYERFSYYVGDDDLTVLDINGNPDPTRQATYFSTVHNYIVAPQLGLEWSKALTPWLAFTGRAKGAWGVDFIKQTMELKRGDGFIGETGSRHDTSFSHMYEMGFFADISVTERTRIRAGYNLMWYLHVAEASSQLDYDLSNFNGKANNGGSIFFHGPSVEFHVLF